jgi:hypothetical protein
LRDTERLGEARWHANMCLHLGINCRSAVAYLQEMAERHADEVAAHLNAAAALYDQFLEQLNSADTSHDAMMSAEGREKLATLAEGMAETDARASSEILKAIAVMDG